LTFSHLVIDDNPWAFLIKDTNDPWTFIELRNKLLGFSHMRW